ncbi:proline-rich receptor-like protein kinase PERK2 [Oryza sativa Japonica Group]|uniref:proline-rich receptor-like protein kinase PERK2 n=1 Tax=Oryza sativa subsp. japonica TaxID=39947 RepID=UPI00339C3741
MAPPIVGNGRAFPGHQPWPPAVLLVAVPPSPMPGSLPHPIKWNPLGMFSSFNPLPRPLVAAPPLPAVVLSLPCRRPPPAASPSSPERRPVAPSPPAASQWLPLPRLALRFPRRPPELRSRCRPSLSFAPAASSRLSLLARAPPGRAVFSLGLAAASSPSVSPPFRGETTGDAPSPAKQWCCRHCTAFSRPGRRARASADVAVSSLGVAASPSTPACPRFRRNVAANLSVRLTGVVRPPVPPHPCTGRPHLHHLRRRSRDVVLGIASPSAEHRRCPSSSSPFILAGSSSRGAASVVGIAAACSSPSSPPCSRCRLPSSSPRRPRSSSSSSSRRSRSSWRSSLRQADRVRRPWFVKRAAAAPSSSSSSLPRRQASCRPCLAFVQGSPPKSFPRRPPPPRPFVVVVPTPRRVVACSFACVLRVAFVVPEVPEAWFVVVAEGSEGRSL